MKNPQKLVGLETALNVKKGMQAYLRKMPKETRCAVLSYIDPKTRKTLYKAIGYNRECCWLINIVAARFHSEMIGVIDDES